MIEADEVLPHFARFERVPRLLGFLRPTSLAAIPPTRIARPDVLRLLPNRHRAPRLRTRVATNVGRDKSQLANMANQAKAALEAEGLEAVADRGYFKGEEILACEEASITVTLPKPQTSGAKSEGRFGQQGFRYVAEEDIYICPAGEKLAHHFTNEENGLVLR